MKVAAFFSDSMWASWSLSRGLPEVIKRMGHECFAGPLPPTNQVTKVQLEKVKRECPTWEELQSCDHIIVCGLEYLSNWLTFLYPEWKTLKTTRCGWFHEDMGRTDRNMDFSKHAAFVDECFLPNPDDAEKFKTKWLPIGVDTEMFKPVDITLKPMEIGFVGLLYEKRQKFLGSLMPYIGDLEIRIDNVRLLGVEDNPHLFRRQTELLAKTYREMEILLNLPSLSKVLVMKVLEAMACGTFVLTPEMTSSLHEKLGFDDAKHLVFYPESQPQLVADLLKHFVNHDDERECIAIAGCEFVRKNFRIEDRIEAMIG